MLQELVYTSAPQGLAPGSSGFCTVAKTAGMSPMLTAYLESRSGYRHLFPPQSEQAALNPVVWAHCVARFAQNQTQNQIGAKTCHILSRIGDAGLDYTKRSNLIAHHLVLDNRELPSCGPAALLASPDVMISQWSVPPHEIKSTRTLANPFPISLKCSHWEALTGDAGWGGVLAESVIRSVSVFILFKPTMELLPLFAESLALLPESVRWKVTFSTYLQDLSNVSLFRWKGILANSSEAKQLRESKQVREAKDVMILDLTDLSKTALNSQTSFVKIARSGVAVPPAVRQPSPAAPTPANLATDLPPDAPPRSETPIEVPAVRGDIYGFREPDMTTTAKKRKRPKFGVWKNQYATRSVAEEKERKAQRVFFTIIGFTSLIILALLLLLGDELFNAGGMRKGVLNSFSAIFNHSQQIQDLANANKEPNIGNATSNTVAPDNAAPQKGDTEEKQEEQPIENGKDHSGGSDDSLINAPLPDELTNETDEELQQRLEEEQRQKEEEEKALQEQRRIEREKQLQKEREEMRQAFQSVPDIFILKEPKRQVYGRIELPQSELQPEFAPFFPYRHYVKLQWFALVVPEESAYHLETVPSRFIDDPHAQWNLIVSFPSKNEESGTPQTVRRPIKLASVYLSAAGLQVEWNPDTVKQESHFKYVNKLPFSFLRFTFGPNELTAAQAGEERPGEMKKPPPIAKSVREMDNFADHLPNVDFQTEAWYKDIPLWEPMQEKAFLISDKGDMGRPSDPAIAFDNVFAKSRFNNDLKLFDIQPSLILEIATKPDEKENILIQCEESENPWMKTVVFVTNVKIDRKTNPVPLTSIEIPLAVVASPTAISVRDTSRDSEREANEKRRNLGRIVKEKENVLSGEKNEQQRKKLQSEIGEMNREIIKANQDRQLIPEARKKIIAEKITLHYSVFLKGKDGTENLLLLKTE